MKIQKFFIFLAALTIMSSLEALKNGNAFRPTSQQQESYTHELQAQLPVDHIFGKNRDEIIAFIHQFPFSDYRIYTVPDNGSYYLDNIDDIIKGGLRSGCIWEYNIADLIKRFARPGSVVLDIGSHIGTHTLIASRAVGPSGKVLAFEPQPKIFRELFMNMSLNRLRNIDFYWVGVGGQAGSVELGPLVCGNEGGTPIYNGTGKFVELLTIDQLNLSNVSLMKIDVEGMENQVLDGARETILKNRPVIIIEIMGGNTYQTAPPEIQQLIMATIAKLNDLGYDVSQIWGHDWLATPKK